MKRPGWTVPFEMFGDIIPDRDIPELGLCVAVATMTALAAVRRGSTPPGIPSLAFLAIPLFDMAMFATFITAALALRRHKEAHKRLMLLAYMSILAAPAARLPGVFPLGPLAFYAIAFVFLAAGIVYDLASRRRIHPAYVWGGALLVPSVPFRLAISGTATWTAIAQTLDAVIADSNRPFAA